MGTLVPGCKVAGIISIEDFIKWMADGSRESTVGERMTHDVKTVYDDEPLVQAVSRMEKYGFGRFPILDRSSGKLLGILTKGNIVKGLLQKLSIEFHEEEIHRYRASHIFEDIISDRTTLMFRYSVKERDFKRAGSGASRLKKTLMRLGVDPHILRRIAIIAYEAEMNIVIYTDGGEILAKVEQGKIVVEATDTGPGIPDVEAALKPGFSTAPDWVRELGFGAGMGLVNIRECADEMNLSSVVGKGTMLVAKILAEVKPT